jgi:methylthioribose-1-phosphate isomerase
MVSIKILSEGISAMEQDIYTLRWAGDRLCLIDQTLLPGTVAYVDMDSYEKVFDAIRCMKVRGAPAIGIAAAYGMVLAAQAASAKDQPSFRKALSEAACHLIESRPTAVNLRWAVDRMLRKAEACETLSVAAMIKELEQEAIRIHDEDRQINRAIGEHLLSLLKDGDTLLTHCNAGALATSEYGTALSVFYTAREKGIRLKAYADETRPRLQGARLTAFELLHNGIDVTLICDNMAAVVMAQGKIDAVIVGCDRIAANGDTANKIGTFGVSILAKHFGIPLYIAAPTPTIDLACPSGADIPIEERAAEEITMVDHVRIAPVGIKTYNPAFDVTPSEHIAAIVTEKGIVYPPFQENLSKLFQ